MFLKSIDLHNIRSYTNQKIEFVPGSVLLSGDIGSGKSSILLAVEFALFGAKQSELPASTLLRHGSNEGFVELQLILEGEHIIIRRYLKRLKQGIKQESGYIVQNGYKKELSPIEMKAEVFEMLGYPRDLIQKNKDLIYRYTVYTPQEELKRILLEDKDTRLDTLRKVFNIDKYKRIKENASVLARSIREKNREYAGTISDLEEKKKEGDLKKSQKTLMQQKLALLLPKIAQIEQTLKQRKQSQTLLEAKNKEYVQLKNAYALQEQKLQHILNERENTKERLARLDAQIIELQKDLPSDQPSNVQEIKKSLEEKKALLSVRKKELVQLQQPLYQYDALKTQAKEAINKIAILECCPLCLQKVAHSHKESIQEKEQAKIANAQAQIELSQQRISLAASAIELLEREISQLIKEEASASLQLFRIKNITQKKEEYVKLDFSFNESKKIVGQLNMLKSSLQQQIALLEEVEEQYAQAKILVEQTQLEEQKLLIEKAGLEKELENANSLINRLNSEIEKKEQLKKMLQANMELHGYLSEFFIQLMSTIEKHVMVHVHREFDALFREWFDILIEDETISVRIDDEFTPVIEQNGYETSIENLSGGEKTSVALAYRLALNKVINDVISTIKTKDILMLDEPTDGFSSEQLDRVREILRQLSMKQIILVSHESKIESFVDSVIRVGKRGHESAVM